MTTTMRLPYVFVERSMRFFWVLLLCLTLALSIWPTAHTSYNAFVSPATSRSQNNPQFTGTHHQASFTHNGLAFSTNLGGTWSWQFANTNAAHAIHGPIAPQLSSPSLVRYDRGALIEQYVQREQGVEQQFVLPRQPQLNSTDLVIAGNVSASGMFVAGTNTWSWADIHLGAVSVFDAQGKRLPASMSVTANGTKIVVDGASLKTAAYPVTIDPLISGTQTRYSTTGPLTTPNCFAHDPDTTYNSVHNEYLVVWWARDRCATSKSDTHIFGQRVNATTGEAIGENFKITDFATFQQVQNNGVKIQPMKPKVSYSSADDRYLVVYFTAEQVQGGSSTDEEDYWKKGRGREVYAQFLNAEGQTILSDDQAIYPDANSPTGRILVSYFGTGRPGEDDGQIQRDDATAVYPDVVYNSQQNEFLVVWSGSSKFGRETDSCTVVGGVNECTGGNGKFSIYGRFVSGLNAADVALRPNPFDPAYNTGSLEFHGAFLIGQVPTWTLSYTGDTYNPHAVYNPDRNEYLVAWQGDGISNDGFEAYGQRINADGQRLNPDNTVKGDDAKTGFRISYTRRPPAKPDDPNFDSFTASLAYNPVSKEYFAAWRSRRAPIAGDNGDYEVYAQRIDAANTTLLPADKPENERAILLSTTTNPSENDGIDSTKPEVFDIDVMYMAERNEYLSVWRADQNVNDKYEIYGQRVSAAGVELGGSADIRISKHGTESSSTYAAFAPVPVFNPTTQQAMVFWQADDSEANGLTNSHEEIFGARLEFTPPQVQSVGIAGGNALSENALTNAEITQLTVRFSEPISNATNTANYLLVRDGNDNTFQSTGCTRSGDDVKVTITGVTFDAANNTATLSVAAPLANDTFRLVACGNLSDNAANLLDGNNDGIPGSDDGTGGDPFIRTFRVDQNAPTITPDSDIVAEATSPAGANVHFEPKAIDKNGTQLAGLTCDKAPDSMFPFGETAVTCSITSNGNQYSQSFKVTVQDTIAPALNVPNAPLTLEATNPAGAVATFTIGATDSGDATPTVECTRNSGATFPIGTTTVACSATDDSGNRSEASFTVTVADTVAPQIIVPPSGISVINSTSTVVNYTVTVLDAGDNAASLNCVPPSGSVFPFGITEVKCSATDSSGNTSSASFLVRVVRELQVFVPLLAR